MHLLIYFLIYFLIRHVTMTIFFDPPPPVPSRNAAVTWVNEWENHIGWRERWNCYWTTSELQALVRANPQEKRFEVYLGMDMPGAVEIACIRSAFPRSTYTVQTRRADSGGYYLYAE